MIPAGFIRNFFEITALQAQGKIPAVDMAPEGGIGLG
jgi:hypothetical protein